MLVISQQVLIRDSFRTPLHNSRISIPPVEDDYRSMYYISINLTDAMSAFPWEPPSVLMNRAQKKLTNISQSLSAYMPKLSNHTTCTTEADVGRAAGDYLTNPVNLCHGVIRMDGM